MSDTVTITMQDLRQLVDEMRRPCYHFVIVREDGPPITGGHVADLDQVRMDAEMLLASRLAPFAHATEAIIVDRDGRLEWSRKRDGAPVDAHRVRTS